MKLHTKITNEYTSESPKKQKAYTLDNSKSPGHDNIGARLIKEVG